MERYQHNLATKFSRLLDEREAQLRVHLRELEPTTQDVLANGNREATDFKEIAEEETQAILDQAQANHAAQELEHIQAARLRLSKHNFGICQDCGQPIDLHRLESLPTTPVCIACQIVRENPNAHTHIRQSKVQPVKGLRNLHATLS
jgi:DnaK suppressor protein